MRSCKKSKIDGWILPRKRKVLLLIVSLSLTCTYLQAIAIQELSIGVGNDWYTMGLGYNHDDGASYGVHLNTVSSQGFSFGIDAIGYTDRIQSKKRYDVLSFTLSYPFEYVYEKSYLSFTGSIGLLLSGNIGFANIQNSYHSLINRDPVSLTYYSTESRSHLKFDIHSEAGLRQGNFKYGLYVDLNLTTGWEQSISAGIKADYSFLILQAGYLNRTIASVYPSQTIQNERYRGLNLSYLHNGGLLNSFYTTYVDTGFSYGGFSFDLLSPNRPKQFEKADITVFTGYFYDLFGQQNRLFGLAFDHYSFEIKHKNGPMFNQMEDQAERMNIGSWMIGYAVDLPLCRLWVPYVKVLGGLARYNLQEDFTQSIIETVLPIFSLEAGLRHAGLEGLTIDRQHYSIRLVATMQYLPIRPTIPEGYEDFSPHCTHITFQLGLVFDIAHDLARSEAV